MATEHTHETPIAPPDTVGDGKGEDARTPRQSPAKAREIGGPSGPEPTRYGDWERKGRCIDF